MSEPRQTERATGESEGFLQTDEAGVVTAVGGDIPELFGVERGGILGEHVDAALGDTAVARCRTAREQRREQQFDTHGVDGRRLAGTVYPTDGGTAVVLREVVGADDRELGASERALEALHEVTTDNDRSVDEKLDRILEVGAERLGTSHAFLAHVENGTHEIVTAVTRNGDNPEALSAGTTRPLSATYCRHTLDSDRPMAVAAAGTERPADPAYERDGLECYLGTTVQVAGGEYGTVCFVDSQPRQEPFSRRERTFVELLTNWLHYLLEQQAYQTELEQQQAFTESLIDSLPDPLYAFGDDGTLVRWNERLVSVTGYEEASLEGMSPWEFVADGDRERIEAATNRVRDGESLSVEATLETADGEQIPYEFSGAPLRDPSGAVDGVVGVGRDISTRTEHQRRLSGLLETTRSFMQAKDPEQVAEIAVSAARELLGFEMSVFRLYDPETETLTPAAMSRRARESLGDRPVYAVEEGFPGEVFATGEPTVVDSLRETDRGPDDVGSAMYYPAGVRGTMSVCSTEEAAFDEADQRLLALLATSAAAACTRAKRERTVRLAQERTERVLDRVNGLVRRTVEVLVEATTREELERGVVRELAGVEPYAFAMVCRPDVASEQLSPTAWAGAADLPAGDWSFPLDGTDPLGNSYRDGEPQLLTTEGLSGEGAWDRLAATVDALVAVPLVYKNTTYGVLVVCAEDADALDERERVVLEALGRASANAVNAVERGRILDATRIVELEFAVADRDLLFTRLSTDGARIESAGIDRRGSGGAELYLSATNVDPDAVLDRVRDDPEVESATCIVARDRECLLEVTVGESLLATLTEYGAALQGVVAEDGTTRVTVELPYEAEARELFDIVAERYPGTELLGYHERERPVETRQNFTAAISDRLTDRQETALRTAYLGGFFDWPRGVDGNELAEAMDISRPTYHQHLRAAQKKVFEELFD
ncbi:MAG: PAS domain S-box-containing protein [Halovenus sp.]|jgi:PAS domain S-box-containing protein